MASLGQRLRDDGLFYALLIGYGYMIAAMTARLWFGDGVNIFATYSDAALPAQAIVDANKVYWSKTSFLFLTLLLLGLNVNFRAAAGLGAVFWSTSLIMMFGASPTLWAVLTVGVLLVSQQLLRGRLFGHTQSA